LPYLLSNFPEDVLVRDAFGGYYPLVSIVLGPFYTRTERGYWVLFGTRKSDEQTACMRIVDYQGVPVLQWKQSLKEDWRFGKDWVPTQTLYVPARHRLHRV
jgi:hypothetical protein